MSDQRSDDQQPLTTLQVDASGSPIEPDATDAPVEPGMTPAEEKVAAELGDFA